MTIGSATLGVNVKDNKSRASSSNKDDIVKMESSNLVKSEYRDANVEMTEQPPLITQKAMPTDIPNALSAKKQTSISPQFKSATSQKEHKAVVNTIKYAGASPPWIKPSDDMAKVSSVQDKKVCVFCGIP